MIKRIIPTATPLLDISSGWYCTQEGKNIAIDKPTSSVIAPTIFFNMLSD